MSSAAMEFVDRRFSACVEELQGWVRQPSISADGTGMAEMAATIRERLEQLGGTARVFEIEGAYPIVYGEFKGKSDRTLLFYNHYDVQRVGPRGDWHYEPFGGEVAAGRMYGRGVADNKGPLLSRIQALEAILQTAGELPVTVKFLVEGEEEIGSPNLGAFIEAHKELLAADACIWESGDSDRSGRPRAKLGNKGMCYVELSARTAKADVHSMYASLIPNAAWRLVWALATLKDENENVLIDGFYDDVVPLSPEEMEILEQRPLDSEGFKKETGVSELVLGAEGVEAARRLYGLPTCTICGVVSGHTEQGARTVLPSRATAKVDFRLVVNQDPEDIFRKLRAHLDRHGFDDIEATLLTKSWPVKTRVTDPFVKTVTDAAALVYDQPIEIQPTSPGSGPRYVFARWTRMPIVSVGVSHIGSRSHGPDENIRLEDYRRGMKHIVAIIDLFGARG